MRDLESITRELDLLEKTQADLAGVASRQDDQRRHDLIGLRLRLSAQIAAVGDAANPLFAGLEDAETARIYRSKYSQMRSAAALHQANWPAVLLGERPDEYRASALAVREANRDFVAWMRATLRTLKR
ncbi:MAG: hypothetical protein EOP58_01655 [Sphingomonadales bacterium]|nr:MAG: hypothetical protein EOP58_01655 [Sphingomonadales bacterium]